ncbi:MAG TPA: hypothetical protein VE890_16550, partial [Thermoguttaceae bacterium]|nr:hypothetical protein [Thermoguttaceae bacterium]
FWRTGQSIQILSRALPHLSPAARTKTLAYLDQLVKSGCPLTQPTHGPKGTRREPFDLGPEMTEFAGRKPSYQAGIAEVYALWAYAHYGDRWSVVLAQKERITELFDRFAENVPRFDRDDMQQDASQHLNQRIAGLLGSARLFGRLGDDVRRQRAVELMAQLVTERVHHERSDHRLVRPTKGETGSLHRAKVPRYVDLVPELADMLGRFAGDSLEEHVSDLQKALPLWYQAYGERMIGGENYISPPHLSRGLFMAWADGTGASRRALTGKLDQPWCRADLYYIEKLSAVLRCRE